MILIYVIGSTAGKILRSHVKGNRAFLITNDLLAPMYLDKYEELLKQGGDLTVGKEYHKNSINGCFH